ncbi:hypothetical protein ACIRQY_10465 [Streptomyces sp. NPDC101490]|uniref:hypothetical protein n=1 Tax=Streptomyces sp. NPDC101490 TaxID=3366143 RepID=UPI003815EB3B
MTTTTPKDTTASGPVWDWAAGHGPVTGALSATTGAFALATTGAATGMPPTWALAVGAAGAIGHTVSTLRERLSARTVALRASSWLLGAGWTTWAVATGPLSWGAIGSLAVLGVAIGTTARSAALFEDGRELELIAIADRQVAAELSAERRTVAAEWVERIQRVAGITVTVLAIEKWPTATGFTIDAELPGGTTYDQVAKESARLSADARLPHGCTVAATPGIHQGRVLIDVATVNVLVNEIPYPADYSPLSIHTGLPWGVRGDGRDVMVFLREQCALIVGPTGSGKTNMVHTVLGSFARSGDILSWVIDLNAGSAGLPWVRPALDGDGTPGRETRPGIDWLASTYDEAMLMLDAALRLGKHRKVFYQDLMARANTDLLPVSAQIPQVMILIDEGAEILASSDPQMRKLAEKILEVIRMLRAMGVRTVLTALGATSSVLGNLMIRREAKARVCLTGGEVEGMDLSKVFPGTRGLRPDQAPYKGAGFVGTPEQAPGLFKSWRITPHQIADIVRATSALHPRLDEASATAAGPAYARRWDTTRTAWMRTTTPATSEQPADRPARETPGRTGAGLNLSALRDTTTPTPGLAAGGPDEDTLAAEFMAQIDAQFGTAPEPTADPSEDDDRPRGLNLAAFRNEQQDSEARRDALALLLAAGPDGTGASAISRALAEEHRTTRQTVVGWLKEWAEDGTAIRIGTGTKTRYVHHRHASDRPAED